MEGGRKEEKQERERGKRFREAKYPFFRPSLFLCPFLAQYLEELPINHYVDVFISSLFFNLLQ